MSALADMASIATLIFGCALILGTIQSPVTGADQLILIALGVIACNLALLMTLLIPSKKE